MIATLLSSLASTFKIEEAILPNAIGAVVSPLEFTTRACGLSTAFGASGTPNSAAVFTVPSSFTSFAL